MDGERWTEIQEVFLEAADRPRGERAAFLDRACAGDPALRREVESLLDAEETHSPLLDASLDELVLLLDDDGDVDADRGPAPWPDGSEGTPRAGPYRVGEAIGRGGMGTVYRAERADERYERTVALKLIRPGVGTPDAPRRFRREQRILASLEHPAIARLYDAGVTEDGRPYLAMELVDGLPIHRFCDGRRLTVSERLDLFVRVADAVDYAHRNLIIHRDLKPSNILVTDDGQVKLLDFGIAKLLAPPDEDVEGPDPDDPPTRVGERLLTPEYASPEQLDGRPLTTAADVYALGVLLHQLLTGRRPRVDPDTRDVTVGPSGTLSRSGAQGDAATGDGDDTSPAAVARLRRTTPGRLRRQLRGELDTIVLKALRPEPETRYPSAAALRDDLVRYREGLPVQARPPSLAYRMRKFVGRNRVPVLAGAAVVIALVSGLGAAVHQARIAREERDVARAVSGFLENLFTASNPFAGERLDTLRVGAFLDQAVERVDTDLADQPAVRARMQGLLGSVHESLGVYDRARRLLEASLATYRELESSESPEIARTLGELGRLELGAGDPAAAEARFREALPLAMEAFGERSSETAEIQAQLAGVLMRVDRLDEAAELLDAAITTRRDVLDEVSSQTADLLNRRASLAYRQGRWADAIETMGEALEMFEVTLGPEHPNAAFVTQNLGFLLQRQGRLEEAEPLLRAALDRMAAGLGPDYPRIGATMGTLAMALDQMGRWEEADSLYRAAIDFTTRVQGEVNMDRAVALGDFGVALSERGELEQADTLLREALRVQLALTGPDAVPTAIVRGYLASLARRQGRPEESEARYREILPVLTEAFPPEHPRVLAARSGIGLSLLDQGRTDEAEAVLTEVWERASTLEDGGVQARQAAENLVTLYEQTGEEEEARRWSERVPPPGG